MKILIIDDNDALRKMIRKHLVNHNYHVVEANSAEQGLECLRANQIATAIVDMRMKEGMMSGLDFLKEYQKISPMTRAIVLTGHPSLHTATQSLAGGPNALAEYYVEKGDDVYELLDLVDKVTMTMRVGRLTLDLRHSKIYIDDQLIAKVSDTQMSMLKVLCRHAEQYISIQQLAQEVRGEAMTPEEAKNSLSSPFKRLRDKLTEAVGVPIIENAYGQGFRLSMEFIR